jgi:hypothetical protein
MVNAFLITGIRELGTLLEPIRPRSNDGVNRAAFRELIPVRCQDHIVDFHFIHFSGLKSGSDMVSST